MKSADCYKSKMIHCKRERREAQLLHALIGKDMNHSLACQQQPMQAQTERCTSHAWCGVKECEHYKSYT